MRHAKVQDHRTFGSLNDFTIYGRGGHLGRVTWTVYKLLLPLPMEAPMDFGFVLLSGFIIEYV